MAALENCVVHLSMRFGLKVLAIGTGFLYERYGKLYIITAWHNVTGRHSESLRCQSEDLAVPDNIVASLPLRANKTGYFRMPVVLPLADQKKALYFVHPNGWPRVDVVAIPFDPESPTDVEFSTPGKVWTQRLDSLISPPNAALAIEICPIQAFAVPDAAVEKRWLDSVDVTEELFVPGYPLNVQGDFSAPVWKRATIASSVQRPLQGQPKFLIDSASQSGMSGSPVVFYSPRGVVRIGGSTYMFQREVAILAGVYVGRVGVRKDADPQIGTVWHRSVIDEIIDGKRSGLLPEDVEASPSERTAAVKKALATASETGIENVKNQELPSRFFVQAHVMELLDGRAFPDKILEEIMEIVQTYDGPYAPDEDE